MEWMYGRGWEWYLTRLLVYAICAFCPLSAGRLRGQGVASVSLQALLDK